MHKAVVPVQDKVLLGDLAAALDHELDDPDEVGLAQRQLVWILLLPLVGSEEELSGSNL